MLQQLEQECLDIYRRKVEKTRKYKADLSKSLAESEAEIDNLISALGEKASCPRVYLFNLFPSLLLLLMMLLPFVLLVSCVSHVNPFPAFVA